MSGAIFLPWDKCGNVQLTPVRIIDIERLVIGEAKLKLYVVSNKEGAPDSKSERSLYIGFGRSQNRAVGRRYGDAQQRRSSVRIITISDNRPTNCNVPIANETRNEHRRSNSARDHRGP